MASSKNSVGMGRGVTAALILLRNGLSFVGFCCFTSRSGIFHSQGDVILSARTTRLRSIWWSFEHGGITVVAVSSEGPVHINVVAFDDRQRKLRIYRNLSAFYDKQRVLRIYRNLSATYRRKLNIRIYT